MCFGSAVAGRVVWAAGYTGLGVGATHRGAQVALDLLEGCESEAMRLHFVRTRPLPLPSEPLRSAVIQLTRNRLAAADRREGRRGLWPGALGRLGSGSAAEATAAGSAAKLGCRASRRGRAMSQPEARIATRGHEH